MYGASVSDSFVSCMSRTSGAARSSHHSIFSSRAFIELTFHVAMRMALRGLAAGLAAAQVGDRHPIHAGAVAAVLLERLAELRQRRPGRVRVGGREHERAVRVLGDADDAGDVD